MTREGTRSLARALLFLDAIVEDQGRMPAAAVAARCGLAPSTARRMLVTLRRHGLVEATGRGLYAGGPRLLRLAALAGARHPLAEAARPALRRLARERGLAAHLGTLDNAMVTYLVKEGGTELFTREGAQLEAYCTGIGKALLAQLPPAALAGYLDGSFVRMTPATICDPDALRAELARTRAQGFAVDAGEMAEAVECVAVPVIAGGGCIAAISLSGAAGRFPRTRAAEVAHGLRRVADRIARRWGDRAAQDHFPA